MRGVIQSEPEFLAVFPSLDAMCLSVSAGIPGSIYQFKCEAFVGQHQNSWRYFPVGSARRFSVRTEMPGGFSQFKCEAFVSPSQCSWLFLPVGMRGVCPAEPKFLAMFTSPNARRFSVSTKVHGNIYHFACEVFVGQNQNSWRYLLIWARGVCRSEPKFLAVFSSLNTRRSLARTQIPGNFRHFACDVSVGQNQIAWQFAPV